MLGSSPTDEFDPELERAAGGGHEGALIESQLSVELPDRRDGRLTDADRADGIGLDQLDGRSTLRRYGERGSAHPPGGTATHDHDASNTAVWGVTHAGCPG